MPKLQMSDAFALVLKKHRAAKGISQEALAERADIHPTHVGLIERCQRNPSLNICKAIAAALGLSLTDMVSEAEDLVSGQAERHRPGRSR